MTVLRAGFSRTRDLWLLVFISTILTLLALSRMGYDLRALSGTLIGGQDDAYQSAWALWQAIDNLLRWPLDLGRASNFSTDPAPFALSTAPYGIAVVALPLYLLSGENLTLTYNLYLIATFPLTTLSVYLLMRHILAAPRPVAGFAALLVTFSAFRFWHLEQVDMLSTHLFFWSLYAFHRLLDAPDWRWAAGLGLGIWLLALSSSYLMVCFVIGAALLSAAGLLFYTDAFLMRLRSILPAGIVSGLMLWPMLAWRGANPAFRAGHTPFAIAYYSAQPADWLVGFSAFYTRQPPAADRPVPLFVGGVLLVIGIVGLINLIWRRGENGPDEDRPRLMSMPTVVSVYAILTVLGWLLTLGPSITLADGQTLNLPYRLIVRWPMVSRLPMTGRTILLTITGLSVLGAYGLTWGLPRLPGRWRAALWTALIVTALIEHVPYAGPVNAPADDSPSRRLAGEPLPARPAFAAWLDSLPADTQFAIYPDEAISAVLFDPITRGRPLINGQSSLIPDWYVADQTPGGVSPYLIGSYAIKGADYLLVYRDAAPERADVLRDYARQADTVNYVGQFDDVVVYTLRVEAVRAVRYDFDGLAPGQGWYEPLSDVSGNGFQWTSSPYSTLDFYFTVDSALRLEARIAQAASPAIFDSLKLRVNGERVTLAYRENEDGSRDYEALIPASLLEGPARMTRFEFLTRGVTVEAQADPDQGQYPYGLLFDWVTITSVED